EERPPPAPEGGEPAAGGEAESAHGFFAGARRVVARDAPGFFAGAAGRSGGGAFPAACFGAAGFGAACFGAACLGAEGGGASGDPVFRAGPESESSVPLTFSRGTAPRASTIRRASSAIRSHGNAAWFVATTTASYGA